MYEFDTNTYLDDLENSDDYWISFHEQDDFELGVLRLNPDQEDIQTPHKSDEVYFIIQGDGHITIGDSDYDIRPGKAFYVPKGISHKIHGNTKPIIAYYALN